MSDFDPTPGKPYGLCLTCSIVCATEEESNEHMRQTLNEAKANGEQPRSHSVRSTNPSRPTRIRRRVSSIIDDAIEGAMAEIDRHLLDRGEVTEAEIATALGGWPDFQEARDDWVAEES